MGRRVRCRVWCSWDAELGAGFGKLVVLRGRLSDVEVLLAQHVRQLMRVRRTDVRLCDEPVPLGGFVTSRA